MECQKCKSYMQYKKGRWYCKKCKDYTFESQSEVAEIVTECEMDFLNLPVSTDSVEDLELQQQKLQLKMQMANLQAQQQQLALQQQQLQQQQLQFNSMLKCPKCGSTSISGNKKGYGVVKGGLGALAVGAMTGGLGGVVVGLGAGNIGRKKVLCTCMSCGKKFKAGKA